MITTESTMRVDNSFIEFEKMSKTCDSNIATIALRLGNDISVAYTSKEIDGDALYNLQRRVNTLALAFTNNCYCKKKTRR